MTELEQWFADLQTQGGLSPEDIAALQGVFAKSAKATEYAKGSVLRHSDYSRLVSEARTKQELAESELKKAQDLIDQNTAWSKEKDEAYQAAIARAQAAERDRLVLQQKLKDDYKVTPETLTDLGLDKVEVKPDPLKQPDVKYLTADDMEKALNLRGLDLLKMNAELFKLNKQHRALYGDDIDDPTEIINYALEKKTGTLKEAWEQKYNVAAKRTEIQEAQIKTRIDTEVARKLEDARSAELLKGTPGHVPDEGLFKILGNDGAKADSEVAARQARVARALAKTE